MNTHSKWISQAQERFLCETSSHWFGTGLFNSPTINVRKKKGNTLVGIWKPRGDRVQKWLEDPGRVKKADRKTIKNHKTIKQGCL